VTIVDSRKEPEGKIQFHDAVMRFRNPDVALNLGIDAKKVIVRKEVFYNGNLISNPTIFHNNLYSLKLYEEIGRRSLNKLGDGKRWISVNKDIPKIPNIIWNNYLIGFQGKGHAICKFGSNDVDDPGLVVDRKYDYLISTIPMPVMKAIIGIPSHLHDIVQSFHWKSITTLTIPLKIKSTVHQTIYFPNSEGFVLSSLYRATIEENIIKLEFIEAQPEEESHLRILSMLKNFLFLSFGISEKYFDWEKAKFSTINIGKIMSISEDLRLNYIMWLTDTFNILSFGRNAIWKPIRADNLLDDIKQIKKLITTMNIEAEYKARLK
jgi:hypothetical protein